jgi:hypothetical protein
MALGGAIWFYAFVECSKGYKFVTTSRVHNGEALYQAIYEAVLFFKRYGHYVRVLRMDAGKVEGAEGLHHQILATPPITVPVPQVISPRLKIGVREVKVMRRVVRAWRRGLKVKSITMD